MTKPKPPKGWFDNPYEAHNFLTPDNRPVECGNCDWTGTENGLGLPFEECEDIWERLDPGSEVPVGECPDCRSFAYYSDVQVAFRLVPNVLQRIAEEIENTTCPICGSQTEAVLSCPDCGVRFCGSCVEPCK